MKMCPYCAEEIQDDATKCKHCGEWVTRMEIAQKTTEKCDLPVHETPKTDNGEAKSAAKNINENSKVEKGSKICPSCKAFQDATKEECPNCGYDLSHEQPADKDIMKKKELGPPLTFPRFIREFFTNYKGFLLAHLVKEKPPFLYLVIWFLGMSSVIDRIEMKYLLASKYQIDNWVTAWVAVLLGGILLGCIGYWIGGALYHVRVWLSGGSKDLKVSRRLFVYTGLPIYLLTIFSQLVDTFVYGDKYFKEPTSLFLDYTWLALWVIAIIYSISFSYRGVRLLQKTKVIRSIIFFIILPAFFYSLFLSGAVYKSFRQYSKGLEFNEQALQHMQKGDYKEAERLFKLALEKMTKDDRIDILTIYGNLGLLYEYKGESNKAIECYEKQISLSERESPPYHSAMGKIHILKGNTLLAINEFEKCLKLNPNDFDAHNELGLILLGEMDEKIVDYERALIHNKEAYSINKNVTTLQNLALNYYFLNKDSEALSLFESINKMSPQNAVAKYYMGLIYYSSDDLTKAKIFLEEAIALDPSLRNKDVESILLQIRSSLDRNQPTKK